jgi:hypothetical protein
MVAVDHLSTLRAANVGCGQHETLTLHLHLAGQFTLMRAMIENASAVLWLLNPPLRTDRVLRRLQLAAGDIRNNEAVRDLINSRERHATVAEVHLQRDNVVVMGLLIGGIGVSRAGIAWIDVVNTTADTAASSWPTPRWPPGVDRARAPDRRAAMDRKRWMTTSTPGGGHLVVRAYADGPVDSLGGERGQGSEDVFGREVGVLSPAAVRSVAGGGPGDPDYIKVSIKLGQLHTLGLMLEPSRAFLATRAETVRAPVAPQNRGFEAGSAAG